MISEVMVSRETKKRFEERCEDRVHRVESLRASSIHVNSGPERSLEEAQREGYSARILIHGLPAGDGFAASSALICFYPDGDARLVKPLYDEAAQQIRIFYPLSQFDEQVEILKSHVEVICTFLGSTITTDENAAFLHGNRALPEKLH